LLRAATLINEEQWQRVCAAAQISTGGVRRAARSTDGQNVGASRAHGAHESRPADIQSRQKVGGR
jgi:hypothetical protein